MKKRTLAIVAVLLVAAVMTGIFAACVTEFQLKFMVDGEVYAVVNTAGEETVKLPENPTKEGYIFDGWYWDDGIWAQPFTAESLLEQKLESDMAVYAKWLEEDITKRTFKVTFDSMSGSAVEPVTALYGTLVEKPSDPTRTGYVFVGWYKQADLSEEWDFSSDTLTENITLYAKWVSESDASGCDILTAEGFDFDAEGKTLSIKTPNSQEYFALSSALTVSPYASWTVTSDAEGREEVPSATVPLQVGDNTFYINITSGTQSNKNQYTVNIRRRAIYTVTYDFAGGGESASEQVEEDGLAPAKEGTRMGYTFSGWTAGETAWNFEESVVTGDITLTAVWTANTYSVTFDAAGGEETEGVEVTFGSAAQLPVPERSGYTFTGWQKDDGTAVSDAAGAVGEWNIAEDVSLTASWSVVTYDVTYNNIEGATHSNPATYTVEDAAVALQDAAKTGYTFLGWYSDAEFAQEVSEIDTSACEEVELWARWEVITYTATFVNSDGTVGTVDFDIEDTALSEPAVPQRTGYTGEWEDYEIKAEDLTINAVYTPITYNITYENTKGAANNNPATYNIETATITLADITSPGYTFEGWFIGEEKVESIELGSYGDITLTAKWTPITYSITYENTKGAANSNPATYNIETAITLSELTSPGYTFEGWFIGEEKVESIELGSYGDVTLTAKWTLTQYTATFVNSDGTVETVDFDIEDTALSEPAVPQRMGYTGEWEDYEIKAEDLTINAVYTPITYNITYENTLGAENSNPATYDIETAITLSGITSPGYTFKGWFVGEEKVESIELGSYGDIALTAKWAIIEYSVNYVLDGGINAEENPSVYTVETLGGADGVIALEDPTKRTHITVNADGAIAYYVYEFLGWYKDSGFEQRVSELSLALGSVTLYAKWSATEVSVNYVRVNENNELDEDGGYILFGQYPQTIKASDVTVGNSADADGYYFGSDGERYAKVVAFPNISGFKFSDNSSVTSGNTYYFKVEPIRWRILSESNGNALILCDSIIANKAYDSSNNNYANSDIRAWLNDEFYKTAFGELQQALIQTTEVDNSVYSTGYSSNPYACENTFDKVFLLSYREVTNSAYGFASSSSTYDTARHMLTSDFSRATGAGMSTESSYYGNGWWWLRSPYSNYSGNARYVHHYGNADYSNSVLYGSRGVVPALNLTLS